MVTLHPFFSCRLLWLAMIASIVMAMSQLLGRYVWQLALFSHYVPQVAVLVLLAAVIYPKPQDLKVGLRGLRRVGCLSWVYSHLLRQVLAMLGVFFIVWSLQPWSLFVHKVTVALTRSAPVSVQVSVPDSKALTKPKPTPIIIAYQNVNIGNQHPDKAIGDLLAATDELASEPDVVALVEAGGANWQTSLNNLARRYPTHCGVDESSPFAMQVYAKETAATCEIIKLQGFALAKLTLAKLAIPNQPNLHGHRIIYVAHPPPPISGYMAQARNAYFNELATLIKADAEHSVMLVGDFNLSAFSPLYRDFIRSSATLDKRLQRTTLTGLPTWLPFGIGIDQVLINNGSDNNDNNKVKTQALAWAGSDHRGFRIVWD